MRWKLLIAASLLAAAVGAASCYAVALFLIPKSTTPPWWVALTILVPIGAITYAAIFVYRHTARRRALQAAATVLLASLLTLTALTLGSILHRRPAPELSPTPPAKIT